jgi:plasmid stability protein
MSGYISLIDNRNGSIMVSQMPSITLKGLPRPLHLALKKRAEQNRRSLNREILATLESALTPSSRPVEELLKEAREFRSRLKIWVTEEQINRYKREGRA